MVKEFDTFNSASEYAVKKGYESFSIERVDKKYVITPSVSAIKSDCVYPVSEYKKFIGINKTLSRYGRWVINTILTTEGNLYIFLEDALEDTKGNKPLLELHKFTAGIYPSDEEITKVNKLLSLYGFDYLFCRWNTKEDIECFQGK